MELGMLVSMLEEDLGLSKVNTIISNIGFSRKSRGGGRGGTLSGSANSTWT